MTIDVKFIDHKRTSTEKPDPDYPDGVRIDLAGSVIRKSCTRNLPYPAPRCGKYHVECLKCGFSALITVAGRPDDPNMITMPCQAKGMN